MLKLNQPNHKFKKVDLGSYQFIVGDLEGEVFKQTVNKSVIWDDEGNCISKY